MQIRWLGQGGYELRLGGETVYLDPYMSDMVEHSDEGLRRLTAPAISARDAHPAYYLATHDHMDHLDTDFIREMNLKGVQLVCTPLSIEKLDKLGVDTSQALCVRPGAVLPLRAFTLEAVFADHTPDSVGFVIVYEGKRYYFTGDTLLHDDLAKNINADVIFCCINGKLGNMNAEEAVAACLRSGAKTAVPNHFGMFAENTCDAIEFVKPALAAGLSVRLLNLHEWSEV